MLLPEKQHHGGEVAAVPRQLRSIVAPARSRQRVMVEHVAPHRREPAPQILPAARVRRLEPQGVAHRVRLAPELHPHAVERGAENKLDFGPRHHPREGKLADRQCRQGPQAHDRLNQAGLPAAVGTDDEVERLKGDPCVAEGPEAVEGDGRDHAKSMIPARCKATSRAISARR